MRNFLHHSTWTVFILLCSNIAFSQLNSFVIKDKQTKSPIAFATIKVLHTPKGDICNESGIFQLDIAPNDSVAVSCVGYQTLKLLGKEISSTIYLERDVKTLDSVLVRETIPVRKLVLGNGSEFLHVKLKCNFPDNRIDSMDCYAWGSANMKEEWAERIDLPDSNHLFYLKKIYMPTRKRAGGYGDFLLRIYATDDRTGLPAEQLYSKLVKVNTRSINKNKIVIDLSSEDWAIQDAKSFCVGVGWPPDMSLTRGYFNILFYVIHKENSFHRNLNSIHYSWRPWGYMGPQKTKISTLFAVELEERKYK